MKLHINDVSIGTHLESGDGEFIITSILFEGKKGYIELEKIIKNEHLSELLEEK